MNKANSSKVKLRKKFEDELASKYNREFARNIIRYDLLGMNKEDNICIVSTIYQDAYNPNISHEVYAKKIERMKINLGQLDEQTKIKNIHNKLINMANYYNVIHNKLYFRTTKANPKVKSLKQMMRYISNFQKKFRSIPVLTPLNRHIITSHFGNRFNPYTRKYAFHSGIDLIAPKDYVHSSAAGKVIFAARKAGYGNLIKINHGNNIITYYAHLDEIYVNKGDLVGVSQIIGLMGNTGNSTGKHLHYEVRVDSLAINPVDFIGKNCRKK